MFVSKTTGAVTQLKNFTILVDLNLSAIGVRPSTLLKISNTSPYVQTVRNKENPESADPPKKAVIHTDTHHQFLIL